MSVAFPSFLTNAHELAKERFSSTELDVQNFHLEGSRSKITSEPLYTIMDSGLDSGRCLQEGYTSKKLIKQQS